MAMVTNAGVPTSSAFTVPATVTSANPNASGDEPAGHGEHHCREDVEQIKEAGQVHGRRRARGQYAAAKRCRATCVVIDG